MRLSAVFFAAPGGALLASAAAQPFLKWKNAGVSTSAPLPPAENFKPRPHGDEAAKAGLKPHVLAKLDVERQRHVAASKVAGSVGLVHKKGVRAHFETFGLADIEVGKPMPKDGFVTEAEASALWKNK